MAARRLGVAKIDNGGGAVELSPESAAKAIESATITGTGNDLTLSIDHATKTAGAYPASPNGQGTLVGLGYAPLPASLDTKVRAAVAALS